MAVDLIAIRQQVVMAKRNYGAAELSRLRPQESSEPIEIVDLTNGQTSGISVPRPLAHVSNLPHGVVHIVILWDRFLVLQIRSFQKDTAPGQLDLAVSGHIVAGMRPLAAAKAELHEELGLHEHDLIAPLEYMGGYPFVEPPSGSFRNTEYRHVFMGRLASSPSLVQFHDGEVFGMVLIPVATIGQFLADAVLPKASALRHSLGFLLRRGVV